MAKNNAKSADTYDASSITVLEGLDPAMQAIADALNKTEGLSVR